MDDKTKGLRALCEGEHVIIVTAYFPPLPGGTSVIIKNILKNLDRESYSIATINPYFSKPSKEPNIHYLMNTFVWSSRLNRYWKDFFMQSAIKKLVKLCKAKKAKYIVGVYPDYHFIKIAYEAAQITGIPLVSYLHDTIAEGLSHSRLSAQALELQKNLFQKSSHIFVMSEGMKMLYKEKYGIEVDTLEHTYPEPAKEVPFNPDIRDGNIFWGGAIYSINQNSVRRVINACAGLEMNLEIASNIKKQVLEKKGFDTDHIKLSFYQRADYLNALKEQQILLLALDWPDESTMHRDELATIFPTKTIEYLHSGRPILVHCPDDYFLAAFINKYRCGIVVSDRSEEKLQLAIKKLKSSDKEVTELISNARLAARVFDHSNLQNKFISTLKELH